MVLVHQSVLFTAQEVNVDPASSGPNSGLVPGFLGYFVVEKVFIVILALAGSFLAGDLSQSPVDSGFR